ncbi:FHA domain-containing protein [Allohahella sp. A8]|uniref:SctD/MshK family protein n=1 Tax=Allohahella sp. A8 TaxID=3141461 RepID=UPI003A7FE22D
MSSMTNTLSCSDGAATGLLAEYCYALTVTSGLHAGARAEVSGASLTSIGASDECDLVLTDETVAARHCMIGQLGQAIFIKSLEGVLTVDGRTLATGEQVVVKQDAILGIGSVAVGLKLIRVNNTARSVSKAGQNRWLLMYPLALMAGVALLWTTYTQVYAKSATNGREVGLFSVGAKVDDEATSVRNKKPVIDAAVEQTLPVDEAVEDGADLSRLAGQVAEIFRLSGFPVQAEALSPGVIQVSGHFDDPADAERIIRSRALREVKALKQVRVMNTAGAELVDEPIEAQKIVRLAAGDDPYLVTADGARYYPGARLSNGFEIASIDSQQIRLVSDTGEERELGAGAVLE